MTDICPNAEPATFNPHYEPNQPTSFPTAHSNKEIWKTQ